MKIARRELVVLIMVCFAFVCLGSSVLAAPWVKYAAPGGAHRLFDVAIGDGVIWFLEWYGDLYGLDNEGQWRVWSLSDVPRGMAVDREGRVWIAGQGAVYYLEGKDSPEIQPLFYTYEICTAVNVDAQGWLWASRWHDPWEEEVMGRKDITGPEWNVPSWDMFVTHWSPYGDDPALAMANTPQDVWSLCLHSVWRWPLSGGSPEGWPVPISVQSEYYPHDIAVSRDWVWEVGSPYNYPPPQEAFDIMRSPDGHEWTPVAHPCMPDKTGCTLCATAVSDTGLWFGCSDPSWLSGGAFWYDFSDWRWFDFAVAVQGIALDEATGDVWFATFDGAYVLRGGPEAWPPVWIELATQEPQTKAGKGPSWVTVQANVWFQMDLKLDVYVAVQDAQGNLYFAPGFGGTMAPMAAGVNVPIGLTLQNFPILTLDLANIPAGTYRWYAACTHAGTMEFASNIASCEWQVTK